MRALVLAALFSTKFPEVNAYSSFEPTPAGSFDGNISMHKVRVLSEFYGKGGKETVSQELWKNPWEAAKEARAPIRRVSGLISKATSGSKF